MHQKENTLAESCVLIFGVGLIGGSVAAAIRQRFPDCKVIGVGRDQERLEAAVRAGLLSGSVHQSKLAEVPAESLGVVCLPVHRIADGARQLIGAGCGLVTDAGSVKAPVCRELKIQSDRFVGSHPIAGSEQSGYEHADPDLFADRLCVVTADGPECVSRPQVLRVAAFWRSLGATVTVMPPEEHDRILALTSHLPHILASVAAGCVSEENLMFTGSGYRDTTRIAAGLSDLWASILMNNSEYCLEAIETAQARLEQFRESLLAGDVQQLENLWESAARIRRQLTQ